MYRDDTCAVCGESLPPDHFYCREHAAGVDTLLHEIGTLLPGLIADLGRAALMLAEVAPETWDYLADGTPGDPDWPPVPAVILRADAEEVDVDVDAEPGQVRVTLRVGLPALFAALYAGLDQRDVAAAAAACAVADGANVTH